MKLSKTFFFFALSVSTVFSVLINQASFSTSFTITPIPSKISWIGALHMKALVVTSLFFSSTWLSLTLLLTCLHPSWLMAAAVSVVSGYLRDRQKEAAHNVQLLEGGFYRCRHLKRNIFENLLLLTLVILCFLKSGSMATLL